ncbi:MAG: lipid-A-disaccharide synthase [Syntrophaceae bacterium]|nr:lipid-A-disaccharide synthase [Syntrophaceae bacterium]
MRPGNPQKKKIMIIAGEASGDLHGSNLVREMLSLTPDLYFYGVGGERLKKAGVELVANSADMAVVGLTEVLSKLGAILKVRRQLKESLRKSRPDLLILIDYPDFNMPMAKLAKKNGIKVFYYISPQVWAWRKGRRYSLGRTVDRMAVILPFEKQAYDDVELDVRFVGHPLLDVVKTKYTREEALKKFGLKADFTTVGILPGSRENEVAKLLPEMLGAADILKEKIPKSQFILPLADTLDSNSLSEIIRHYPADIKITKNAVYDTIAIADIAMVASGTATLETALLGTPMIVAYKVSPLSYLMGRIFIDIDHIGLVNIIAGKTVAPEFIQGDAKAEKMAEGVFDILDDKKRMDEIKAELKKVREKLGNPGAAKRAATMACELLKTEI